MTHATLLQRFEHWVGVQPDAVYFTQPVAPGQVVDYTWREVDDQVRCMAAHLQSLNFPPRSNIAILGKNSAHWIMADLAIWMAGHVSVPLYPTLNTFVEDLQRARPTLFFSVPRLWTKFYLGVCEKLPPAKQKLLFRFPFVSRAVKKKILTQLGLQYVRAAICGSAPLAPSVIAWYRSLGLELLEGYAMSENFAYSHGSLPGRVRVGYVGNVNPGCEHRIGDNGEVLVRSPGQMMGYYKLPELTAESYTPDGFFKTGDMGEIDAEGRLRITGRVKELFKTSKGKYVAPVPIENCLNNHPAIEAVCVTGVGQPQPFALVMLSVDAQRHFNDSAHRATLNREFAELLEQVNAALEDHEQLDYLAVVQDQWTMDNGFLTPTMKIKRNVIEKKYEPLVARWARARQKVVWE